MEVLSLLFVVGCVVWLMNQSGDSAQGRSSASPRAASEVTRTINQQTDFKVVKSGFQPSDRCSCGGSWVKRANIETGGRFFSCSNYPRCTKSRMQVLKEQLGSRYSLYYCSRGHEKAHFGVEYDQKSGRQVCKRCIAKGYIRDPGMD